MTDKPCILCGRCLEVCPLFAATGREELSPRGKGRLFDALAEAARSAPRTETSLDSPRPSGASALTRPGGAFIPAGPDGAAALARLPAERLAALCLGCGRCGRACPQGISAPERLATLRDGHPAWRRWLWKAWLGPARPLWPLVGRLTRDLAGPASFLSPGASRLLAGLTPAPTVRPWLRFASAFAAVPAKSRPAPLSPAGASLSPGAISTVTTSVSATTDASRPAVLFPGCVAGSARRDWADKAETLLRLAGLTVLSGRNFGCCGLSLAHAGLADEAAAAWRRNVHVWRELGRPLVVTLCATCRHGLTTFAPSPSTRPAKDDLDARRELAEAVRPLSALLAERLPLSTLDRPPCSAPGRSISDHPPCSTSDRSSSDHPPCSGPGRSTAHLPPSSAPGRSTPDRPTADAGAPSTALGIEPFGAPPPLVVHHRPCHAGPGDPDALFLSRLVSGTLARPFLSPVFRNGCCGFGGLTRLAAPELPDRTAAVLFERLAEAAGERGLSLAGAQAVTGCSACALQLAAAAPAGVAAGHWLDLFALPTDNHDQERP